VKFCDLLIQEGLQDLKWFASARVDLITKKLALKLKKAGCASVAFGFESHSQEVLDYYNKRVTVEQQQRAIDVCKEVGIPFKGSYIVGARNEEENTLEETFKFCERNNLTFQPDHLLMPQPQTAVYAECVQRGLIKDELDYIKKLSSAGDTDVLVVNVTDELTDQQLLSLFYKYRKMAHLPSRRIKNIIKDPSYAIGKLKQLGITKAITRLTQIALKKDLQYIDKLKAQSRNEWN
jgi:radical SAM superfamily enzyme YgiQ (UPF0313 family)